MNKKRLLAGVLAVLMAFPANAATVFAEEVSPEVISTAEESVEIEEVVEPEEPEVEPAEEEATPTAEELAAEEPAAEEVIPKEDPTEETMEEEGPEEVIEGPAEEEPAEEASAEEESDVAQEEEEEAEPLGALSDECLEVVDGVLKLKDGKNLDNVSEITIPADAVSFEQDLFIDKSNITKVVFAVGNTMTSVPANAFENCSNLKKVELSGSIVEIEAEAFQSCESLEDINLDAVEVIGNKAFEGCSGLDDDVLADTESLSYAGDYAFSNTGVKDVYLANNTGDIILGAGVFSSCKKLTVITLPGKLTKISDDMFSGCEVLTTVNGLSENITGIGSRAFQNCKALSSMTLPTKLESVGSNAFENCKTLKTISLPESVTKIGSRAFWGCEALTRININQNVEKISTINLPKELLPEKTLTIKGYVGTVEDYAELNGYTFKALGTSSITVEYKDKEAKAYGTITCTEESASPGETIYVTMTPDEGKWVEGITVAGSDKLAKVDRVNGDVVIYRFEMPAYDVKIVGDFGRMEELDNVDFDISGSGWKEDANTLRFDQAGEHAELSIFSDNDKVGAWKFEFESSVNSVAVVDDDGTIRSVGKGTTTITVYQKMAEKSSKDEEDKNGEEEKDTTERKEVFRFIVSVGADVEVTDIALVFPEDGLGKGVYLDADPVGIPIVRFNSTQVSQRSRSFDVEIIATNEEKPNVNLYVPSKWSAVDSEIVSFKSSSTTKNLNRVNVKKGAEGETTVWVKITNANGETVKEKFIVQVVDGTPRLADDTLTVNSLSTQGTQIDLVPVYDFEIDKTSLNITEKIVNSDTKTSVYVDYEDLAIFEDDGKLYIRVAEDETAVAGTYKNLYIEGSFASGKEDTFRVPITSLKIVEKLLKPTVKMSGKLNLFYQGEAAGEIVITQNLEEETVERCWLVDKEVYKDPKYDEDDIYFAKNFEVTTNADGEWVIRRTNTDIGPTAKKPTTSGYLYIQYEGYTEPVKKAITLSTTNKKPSYVLSMTKATASDYSENQEYALELLDKKTKKTVELSKLEDLWFDKTSKGTTANLWEEWTAESIEEAQESNTIILQIAGRPYKGKAVFYVQMEDWNEPLKYTFNLSVISKLPTLKLETTTLNLNSNLPKQSDSANVACSQTEAAVCDGVFAYAGSSKLAAYASAIEVVYADGKVTAQAADGKNLVKGSYKFSMIPSVQFEDGGKEWALSKPLTVNVKVTDVLPELKLKKSSYTLNGRYAGGGETVAYDYLWKNIPDGSDYILDDSELMLIGSNAAASNMREYVEFILDDDEQTAGVRLKDDDIRKGKYIYTVTGLKFVSEDGDGDGIPIKDFKITVQVTDKEAAVKVSSKGKLNLVDRASAVVYKAKVSNVNSGIESVEVIELDDRGREIDADVTELEVNNGLTDELVSRHFWIKLDEEKGEVSLYARSSAELDKSETYTVQLKFALDAVDGYTFRTTDLKIKPTQTLPKVKLEEETPVLYAGERYAAAQRTHSLDICVSGKSEAVIWNVQWNEDKVSDELKEAFGVAYARGSGEVLIWLKNAAVLKQDKTYTLPLEAIWDGQMENTSGTAFTVKVTVKK